MSCKYHNCTPSKKRKAKKLPNLYRRCKWNCEKRQCGQCCSKEMILNDLSYPNNGLFSLLRSGKCFCSLKAKKEMMRRSFFPQANWALNWNNWYLVFLDSPPRHNTPFYFSCLWWRIWLRTLFALRKIHFQGWVSHMLCVTWLQQH